MHFFLALAIPTLPASAKVYQQNLENFCGNSSIAPETIYVQKYFLVLQHFLSQQFFLLQEISRSYIFSIVKNGKKNWRKFVLWSFFFLRLLCISINLLDIHLWNTVVMSGLVRPSCYLELLEKLQKRIFRTVGPSLATCLEP